MKTFVDEDLKDLAKFAQEKVGRTWSELSEEEKKAIFYDYLSEREILDTQLAISDDLLQTPAPEGRMAGNVYVASDPMESLGAAARQLVGAIGLRRTRERQRELRDMTSMGQRALADYNANIAADKGYRPSDLQPVQAPKRPYMKMPQTTEPVPGTPQTAYVPSPTPENAPPQMGEVHDIYNDLSKQPGYEDLYWLGSQHAAEEEEKRRRYSGQYPGYKSQVYGTYLRSR